jgi:hypothetical protein
MKTPMKHLLKVRVKKPKNYDFKKKEKAKKEKLEVEVDEDESVVDAREKQKRNKMRDRKGKKANSKKMRKDYRMFVESDVKIDMLNENLKPKKIRVASNLLVESRIITDNEPGSKFSYPGIAIVCKMNDRRSSEFNFSITVASRIVSAIEIIIKNN